MTFCGTIHKYGDHVDTDVILPGRYLTLRRPEELAAHCLEGLDVDFTKRARRGDILVAGRNFGSGSSREHAPIAIKAIGIGCVVAESFSRIFFRNAINIGLPVVVSPPFVAASRQGAMAEVDLEAGLLSTAGQSFRIPALPVLVQEIIQSGGLVPFVKARLAPP